MGGGEYFFRSPIDHPQIKQNKYIFTSFFSFLLFYLNSKQNILRKKGSI